MSNLFHCFSSSALESGVCHFPKWVNENDEFWRQNKLICYIWDSLMMIYGIFRLRKFKLGCNILLDMTKLNWSIWRSFMRSYYCRTWEKIMVQYDYKIFYMKKFRELKTCVHAWIPPWTTKLHCALC